MGDDTSKALIVGGNNSTGVRKNSDHLTPLRWQPLEVTTFCVCVCLCIKESLLRFGISVQQHFLYENKLKESWKTSFISLNYDLITVNKKKEDQCGKQRTGY